MKQNQHIVAIEIGSSKVVGAIAEIRDGRIDVKHIESEPQINCVSYGQVVNVENIKSNINRILHNLEHTINGTIKQVYVGIGGRSLHSEASEVKRSIDATQAIKDVTIKSIIDEASRNGIKKYETITAIPYEYYIDDKRVTSNNPVGQYGSKIKIKYNHIVASPPLMLNLERVASTLSPRKLITTLAMGEHVLTHEDKRLGCMLVDMGAETTSVAIYKDGMLVYTNTLPLGGRNITLDIANGLGQLEETAERIKKSINNPLDHTQNDSIIIEGINSHEAANYINARTGEIIANINKQLEFAGMPTGSIPVIVLAGGAAQLKGVAKKLEEVTKITVKAANMPNNAYFSNPINNKPEFISVVSLIAEAARTIDPMDTCVTFNNIYNDGPIVDRPQFHDEPVVEVNTETTTSNNNTGSKGPKKPGIWERFKKRAENLLPKDDDE